MRGIILTAMIACVAAAGCDGAGGSQRLPGDRPMTQVQAETGNIDTVAQEEPAVARSQWRAVSDEARRNTGNLRVSIEGRRGGPVVFAFANGVTIRAQAYDVVDADRRSGAGGSFANVMGGDPRVQAYLYRVMDENLIPGRRATGGLCGTSPTRHLAVSEFVDSSGRWVFKIAAFRGDAQPPSNVDPEFCGAFAYTAQ